MSTATYSFVTPPHKDGHGMPLPVNQCVPHFRGSLMSARGMIRKLDEALEQLSDCECCFWACEGPKRPRHMVTCWKCHAMRQIAIVRASIARHERERLAP